MPSANDTTSHVGLILPFHDPIVRDLAWLLSSPGMIAVGPWWPRARLADDIARNWSDTHLDVLNATERNPAPLHEWLKQRQRKRLGHYAEDLLAWWLQVCPEVARSVHGLQLTAPGGNTTGELDLAFSRYGSSAIEHWEITVKWFLRTGTRAADCRGPDARSCLAEKLTHLHEHQLQSALTPPGQRALSEVFGPFAEVSSRALAKGWIFHPVRDGSPEVITPDGVAEDHQRGWWAPAEGLRLPRRSRHARYAILPKSRWLAPARFPDSSKATLPAAVAVREVQRRVRSRQRPELLAELVRDLDGAWIEVDRGFITPRGWPNEHPKTTTIA